MFKFFKIQTSATFEGKIEKFWVGVIFSEEEEITLLKKQGKWYKSGVGHEVLKNSLPNNGEQTEVEGPLVIILDNSFVIRNISLDREFFGYTLGSKRASKNLVQLLIKLSLIGIIKIMQKTMETNEVNIDDFVAKISKDSYQNQFSISWDDVDSQIPEISFCLLREPRGLQLA